MAQNISKYVQLNDFLLLEYEFNREGNKTNLSNPQVTVTKLGTKYFFEGPGALGESNNILPLNSVPINKGRTTWAFDPEGYDTVYPTYWKYENTISILDDLYPLDIIKVHVVSGYNFDDIEGFLLQIRALNKDNELVDLSNFTYAKQPQTFGNKVIKFASNTLFLGNRFYDKYIEFKIPSIQELGGDISTDLGQFLDVVKLSDVYITYSGILNIIEDEYTLDEQINVQLPVTSVADNFNCFIAESTAGDFIEYYATWNKNIIGDYMGDIESGIIRLYTSNNPNDNFEQFTETYGSDAIKWVIIHEITVQETIPGGTSLISQKFAFTQDSHFSQSNYFRPILKNADIDSSYEIQYVCRLVNRMDGTQIIRKASFSSTKPKKYGLHFTRLNVDNLIPYKVFNRVESETPNIKIGSEVEKVKYIKVFYDTIKVVVNYANEIFPQGVGPLFLKTFDSVYKFKFEKIDSNGDRVNVDLSGAFNYALQFKLDDNTKIEIGPTYSTNMNTTLGEIEFKLNEEQLTKLKNQSNDTYSIIVKNPNGTSYTFYEGTYYDIGDEEKVMENYESLYTVTDLQTKNAELQAEVQRLTDELATLKETE